METPFLGEISMCARNFTSPGWLFCNGAILPISQYEALFVLLGTTYGGDGVNTFALPNLCGRVPIHMGTRPGGSSYLLGQSGGSEKITLSPANLPAHEHAVTGSISFQTRGDSAGNFAAPEQHSIAQAPLKKFFGKTQTSATMAPLDSKGMIGPAGNSMPHSNMQPYCTINFIICTEGIFPTQG